VIFERFRPPPRDLRKTRSARSLDVRFLKHRPQALQSLSGFGIPRVGMANVTFPVTLNEHTW
jgi:hypothetical protein